MFSAQNPTAEYCIIKLLKALMVLMYWLGIKKKKNANEFVVERAAFLKKKKKTCLWILRKHKVLVPME